VRILLKMRAPLGGNVNSPLTKSALDVRGLV
jgi:hypothetical protein